jgi:hypothetical protein
MRCAKRHPTIAEFFQKNGYSTYFSGKWHLGDKPTAYPIEHGFDEMKAFAAYYPGVYTYADTSKWFHPWFPSYNQEFAKEYFDVVNMYEWEGTAGQPAKRGEYITYDTLATFDVRQTIDNSAYILGRAKHSARRSWVYIDGESFMGARVDIGGDPNNPDVNIAWKYLWTAKDTWLGMEQNLGAIGALYNLTMDPFEKYDMTFNGAVTARLPQASPGKYAGQDNGWVLALIIPTVMEFNKSIVDYPSIKRYPGGASNDWRPNLQEPNNPVPLLDMKNPPRIKGSGG